ncbi:MAG: Co2+/Mg2+ efflux protein ApaG [Limnohabitans sp.]|nr:Co2+/Mg2+ efflux protein ApaG [Limnohabitans sp.]
MTAIASFPRHGSDLTTDGVRVTVRPAFLSAQSSPADKRFLFSYTVAISNGGESRIRLATRHWRMIDADGDERVVEGPGVVGEHPELSPGDSFEYSSFCPMLTSWGTMEGHFTFERDGKPFRVDVGRFYLVS